MAFQIFDNEEYDCRTPEEWISLGLEPGSHDRKPVPGKALLPTDDVLGHGKACMSYCSGGASLTITGPFSRRECVDSDQCSSEQQKSNGMY